MGEGTEMQNLETFTEVFNCAIIGLADSGSQRPLEAPEPPLTRIPSEGHKLRSDILAVEDGNIRAMQYFVSDFIWDDDKILLKYRNMKPKYWRPQGDV